MDSRINNGMCRCCASEGTFKDLASTYHWMGEEEIYAEMLKECLDIHLSSSEDGEEGGICEVCITQLRNASNFKKQVLHTERQFKKRLQERLFKTSIVKVEVPGPDEDALESDNDNNVSEDFSGTEYEVPIKEEIEEPKPKKRATKATTSRVKKLKSEHGETSTKRTLKRESLKSKVKKKKQKVAKVKPGAELEKHRSNVREIIVCSNATPIRCRGGIGYACCFCSDQYPNPADLKKHTIDAHDDSIKETFMKGRDMISYIVKLDITELRCKLCEVNIDTVESMIDHLHEIHKRNVFPDVKNHILPFKFESETLRCFICLNVFNKFKVLQEHMNTHYRNFVCEVCDAGFVNRHILYCHTEIHRTGSFKCTQCQLVFETVRKRKFHIRSAHGDMNLHKCGYCNQRFRENWYKNEHLAEVHGIKSPSVKCQACDKSFDTRQGWLLHTKRVHLMQKQHKCTECEMEFFSKRELNDHAVKHTGSREHQCEICMKFYGRMKTLKDHMRRVHTEKHFKCVRCNLSFVQKSRLKIHLMSKHKEEMPPTVLEEHQ